jgi:hypothetical protein
VAPIALPRGTRIVMRYTYDNSDANEDNPSDPPRRVTWGPQSSDEMGNLGIQPLPRSAADAAVLVKSFEVHAAGIDLAGAQMLARDETSNPAHFAAVGIALSRLVAVHSRRAGGWPRRRPNFDGRSYSIPPTGPRASISIASPGCADADQPGRLR